MKELDILINYIDKKFKEINSNWENNDNYKPINMKRRKVNEIYQDEQTLEYIIIYREFINKYFNGIMNEIENFNTDDKITYRLKQINSIQYKIENYNQNNENGKIPIKKCLNDILGFRLIIEDTLEYEIIKSYIKEKYPKLKCINANKGEYKAVHIYFGNEDNKNFQWELQLWDKKHTESNLKSHKKYKQDYIVWEKGKIKEVNK